MAITSERLRQTFSEGGAQEIYREIKATGGFLDFARRYVFDKDYRVARSALWGLTKATDEELSELQVTLNELIDQAMQTGKFVCQAVDSEHHRTSDVRRGRPADRLP